MKIYKPNNYDICPKAEKSVTISHRLACESAKDPETFDKFCDGNYDNCPTMIDNEIEPYIPIFNCKIAQETLKEWEKERGITVSEATNSELIQNCQTKIQHKHLLTGHLR